MSAFDHHLIEIGADDRVLPEIADLILPWEDEFGLTVRLPDEGALIELIGPTGCLADTANIERLGDEGWSSGSDAPPATMERTDPFSEDADENWHMNLGLVRTGIDAFGNLVHGTPSQPNSPLLAESLSGFDYASIQVPMGEPIVLSFGDPVLRPADERLWHVVVTQGPRDEVLEVVWAASEQVDGSTAIVIQSNALPLNTTLNVWVRTPMGEVLFVPIFLYPY